MLRDLYPPLPNPHLLSSSGAAATAMTVSVIVDLPDRFPDRKRQRFDSPPTCPTTAPPMPQQAHRIDAQRTIGQQAIHSPLANTAAKRAGALPVMVADGIVQCSLSTFRAMSDLCLLNVNL
jgi:hypothetical protein